MENKKFIVIDQRIGKFTQAFKVFPENINNISIVSGRRVYDTPRIKTFPLSNFFRKLLFMKTKKPVRNSYSWINPLLIIHYNDETNHNHSFNTYAEAKEAYDTIRNALNDK